MERGIIPGNLHFDAPNENIPALMDGSIKVITEPTTFSGGYLAMNSFGFGGANAHVVFKPRGGEQVAEFSRQAPKLPRLALMCGRTEQSLDTVRQSGFRDGQKALELVEIDTLNIVLDHATSQVCRTAGRGAQTAERSWTSTHPVDAQTGLCHLAAKW